MKLRFFLLSVFCLVHQILKAQTVTGWDAAITSQYGTNIYHLIGTYQGWDADAIYIAGYNFYNSNAGQARTKRVFMGGLTADLQTGNIGIGTGASIPGSRLHIISTGGSVNSSQLTSGGGIAIQANTSSRSTAMGPTLEFVQPANSDGTNFYGQGRIMTVAGNSNTSDATGKMILGTRRMIDKYGQGNNWYYGDDLVINGNGYVGIGTLTPQEALSVNGKIRSKEVRVEVTNWPDFVFNGNYAVPTLSSVKQFILTNQHLPELPSAEQVERDGISLGELNRLLTKKIEELTLYAIQSDEINKKQKKELDAQKVQIESQNQRLNNIERQLKALIKN